jgi:hypothetical protein
MGDVFGVGKVIEKLMDPVSELVKKLAGPAAEEVGLSLQDSVKVWRAKRQYRVFEKMNGFIADAGFEPKAIGLKTLLPALDYASVEDDDHLHTTWAALLANASDGRENVAVIPAFPITLRALRSADVKFLAGFYELALSKLAEREEKAAKSIGHDVSVMGVSVYEMLELCRAAGLGELRRDLIPNKLFQSEDEAKTWRSYEVTRIMLEREGLIRLGPGQGHYYLTAFGVAFIRACQPPAKS